MVDPANQGSQDEIEYDEETSGERELVRVFMESD